MYGITMDQVCSGISLSFDDSGNAVVKEGKIQKPKKIHWLQKLIGRFFEVRSEIDEAMQKEMYFNPQLLVTENDLFQEITATFDGLFGHNGEEPGEEWHVHAEDLYIVDEYCEKILPLKNA